MKLVAIGSCPCRNLTDNANVLQKYHRKEVYSTFVATVFQQRYVNNLRRKHLLAVNDFEHNMPNHAYGCGVNDAHVVEVGVME